MARARSGGAGGRIPGRGSQYVYTYRCTWRTRAGMVGGRMRAPGIIGYTTEQVVTRQDSAQLAARIARQHATQTSSYIVEAVERKGYNVYLECRQIAVRREAVTPGAVPPPVEVPGGRHFHYGR